MSSDINRLLEDICIRHAKKHVDSYVKDFEQALGINLKLGCQKYEYVYAAKYNSCAGAKNKQKHILEFERHQTLFSIETCTRNFGELYVKFKFHPENAV